VTAVGALLVIAALAVLGIGSGPSPDDPSSRSAGRSGTLALYTWLHDGLGLSEVHRISGAYDLGDLDVLIVNHPTVALSDADARAVLDLLRGGGTLLLTVDGQDLAAAAALLDRLGIVPLTTVRPDVASSTQPIDPGDRVHAIPLGAAALAFRVTPDVSPLLTSGGRTVMVGAAVGGGRAYVLGSPYPLSNIGLRPSAGDTWALVLALLERARGGRIGFDEVHHGEGAAATGAEAIFAGPVGLAAGLAGTVVFFWLALSGRRLGRPLPREDPARVPTASDFVDAMTQLYARSRLRGAVAGRYAEELKQRVGAATGADPHLDDAAFCAAIAGYGADRSAAVAAALGRARALAASRPAEAELLALARQVDEVEGRW